MVTGNIAFLGAGAMAESIIGGILAQGTCKPEQIIISDINKDRLDQLKDAYGVRQASDNIAAISDANIIVLAVKPQHISGLLKELKSTLQESRKLIISILAGVKLGFYEEQLSDTYPVIRVMPNTPAMIRQGAIAISSGKTVAADELDECRKIFAAVGDTVIVNENLMDAVTGLSGSGPAYVYTFIEALADAGVREGLPRDMANLLAVQTVIGAAQMVKETGQYPAVLRDKVTSPGGTTIAGLHALEEGKLRATIMNGVHAATVRSIELSKQN